MTSFDKLPEEIRSSIRRLDVVLQSYYHSSENLTRQFELRPKVEERLNALADAILAEMGYAKSKERCRKAVEEFMQPLVTD